MAIATPALLSNTVASGSTAVSDSISPSANALLIVAAISFKGGASGADLSSITDTLSGTSAWTAHEEAKADLSGKMTVVIATAITGGTPGSGTITVNWSLSTSSALFVTEVASGFDPTTPVAQSNQAAGTGEPFSVTLPSAPPASSLVVGAIGDANDTTQSPDLVPPASFTELAERAAGDATGTVGLLEKAYDNGDAPQTVEWTGTLETNTAAVAIEVQQDPALTDFTAGQSAYAAGAAEVDLYGRWYEHYYEWDGWTGSAFDIIASVTFTHATADSITTQMFWRGNDQFAWRFTGIAEGTWSWTTSSTHAPLDGDSGTIEVGPRGNADHKGFIGGSTEKRWVWSDGTVFVPQVVSVRGPPAFRDTPSQIDTWIANWVGTGSTHGFTGLHTILQGHLWQADEHRTSTVTAGAEPHLANFAAYEDLIWKVYDAGGHVAFFWFGEDVENSASIDLPGGANGLEDERAQRYLAARLGPVPGFTFTYGHDLFEWATDAMITTWAGNLDGWFGWNHLKAARGDTNAYTRTSAAGDYTSWEWWEPTYQDYLDHITNADAGEPVFSEDRFRVTSDASGKNYTEEQTRRGLYHSFFAGGVANSWANATTSGYDDVTNFVVDSDDYANPHWILNYLLFVSDRFSLTAVRDNTLTNADAFCLKDDTAGRRMFYREAAGSVDVDLTGMASIQTAVAVDTIAATYTEIDISGDLTAGQDNTWTAPSTTDWAILVEEPAGAVESVVFTLARTHAASPVGTKQVTVYPVSDAYVGTWTPTPLYQQIDEVVPSDADLIESEGAPANSPAVVGLGNATDPEVSTNHIVRYRYQRSAGTDAVDLAVELRQGYVSEASPGTLIATWSHTGIGDTVTEAEQVLTTGQADTITDYADLYIRFVANAP